MEAGPFNLRIERGSTYRLRIRQYEPDGTTPKPFAGCLVRAAMGAAFTAARIHLTAAVEDDATGISTIEIPPSVTNPLTWAQGFWDYEVYDPADATNVIKTLKGTVLIFDRMNNAT